MAKRRKKVSFIARKNGKKVRVQFYISSRKKKSKSSRRKKSKLSRKKRSR